MQAVLSVKRKTQKIPNGKKANDKKKKASSFLAIKGLVL